MRHPVRPRCRCAAESDSWQGVPRPAIIGSEAATLVPAPRALERTPRPLEDRAGGRRTPCRPGSGPRRRTAVPHRPLPRRAAAGRGRLRPGLPGPRRAAPAPGGGQGAAPAPHRQPPGRRCLPGRGPHGGRPRPPAHRPRVRRERDCLAGCANWSAPNPRTENRARTDPPGASAVCGAARPRADPPGGTKRRLRRRCAPAPP